MMSIDQMIFMPEPQQWLIERLFIMKTAWSTAIWYPSPEHAEMPD